MNKEQRIGFYNIPLDKKLEEIQKELSDDTLLHDAIIEHSKELAEDNYETWLTDRNLIVTEIGYRIALYMPNEETKTEIDSYIESCEKTVKHLITLIYRNNLQKYFSKQVLEEAINIRNIYVRKQEE